MRNAPRQFFNALWPVPDVSELPSDKVVKYTADYNGMSEKPIDEDGKVLSLEDYLIGCYCGTVDQLNELVINLKKDPL